MKLGKIFKNTWAWLLFALALVLLAFIKPITETFKNVWRSSKVGGSQLQDIADNLYNSMKLMGTNEQKMFDALAPLSGAQLRKVYEYYGVRNYYAGGRFFGMGIGFDLFEWFHKELNGKETKQMRSIWAKSMLELTF